MIKIPYIFRGSVAGLLENDTIEIQEDAIFDVEIMKFLISKAKELYTCKRPPGPAGALLVTGRFHLHILASATSPPSSRTCFEVGCEIENGHCVRTNHAEMIAIAIAARQGIPIYGATMYSILKPCYQCSKMIAEAGIFRVYFAGKAYDEQRTKDVLSFGSVEITKLEVGLDYGN
jgi:deoxycytidylate deaminase